MADFFNRRERTAMMTDSKTTLRELSDLVLAFSRERNWEQFHHPKDLGVALACEVGEILEHFRYKTDEQIRESIAPDTSALKELSHEFADCLWLLLRLAEVCQVDLAASLEEKVALAALKYPVEKSFGRADKYTRYQEP